MKYRLIPDWL
jgi:hypothetical protein